MVLKTDVSHLTESTPPNRVGLFFCITTVVEDGGIEPLRRVLKTDVST